MICCLCVAACVQNRQTCVSLLVGKFLREGMHKLEAELDCSVKSAGGMNGGYVDQRCHARAADALLRIFNPLCRTDLSQGNIHEG